MKTSTISQRRILGAAALALVGLLALPATVQAKGHGNRDQRSRTSQYNQTRQYYSSQPRSTFVLSMGTGYAGRGYY